MRPSSRRLFATVKSAAKYLEPNTPTGLTGLTTHPSPRPALIYNYNLTLQKLAQFPANSVYRQSTEALTKHRLKIIEATKPAGYDEWLVRVKQQIDANPEAYGKYKKKDGEFYGVESDVTEGLSWDGKFKRGDFWAEGPNTQAAAEAKARAAEKEIEEVDAAGEKGELPRIDDLEPEPPLDADQISQIEHSIGAGLIEEVVQVAEGELQLVDQMLESKSWEPLEEHSPPGQWEYFDRGEQV